MHGPSEVRVLTQRVTSSRRTVLELPAHPHARLRAGLDAVRRRVRENNVRVALREEGRVEVRRLVAELGPVHVVEAPLRLAGRARAPEGAVVVEDRLEDLRTAPRFHARFIGATATRLVRRVVLGQRVALDHGAAARGCGYRTKRGLPRSVSHFIFFFDEPGYIYLLDKT